MLMKDIKLPINFPSNHSSQKILPPFENCCISVDFDVDFFQKARMITSPFVKVFCHLIYYETSKEPLTSVLDREGVFGQFMGVEMLLLIVMGVFHIIFIAAENRLWIGHSGAVTMVLFDSLGILSSTWQIKLNREKMWEFSATENTSMATRSRSSFQDM